MIAVDLPARHKIAESTRTSYHLLVGVVMLLAPVMAAVAQSGADYRLASDDVLGISVMDQPQLSSTAVRIAPDGTIAMPVVGRLRVAGMTLAEVEAAIANALRQRLVNPQVTVTLQSRRTNYVFVLGAVTRPGSYPLGEGWAVAQLVASAGGLITDVGSVTGALLRADGTRAEVDLQRALSDPAAQPEWFLRPGDVLDIRKRTVTVTVAGAVMRPGRYDVTPDANLVDVLSLAGGLAPTARATLGRVTLERANGERLQFDLAPALLRGEPVPRVPLANGDTIVVPTNVALVSALGDLLKPGSYPFDPDVGMRVSDLIALAGGLRVEPARSRASIFRSDGSVLPLDLVAIIQNGDKAADLPLQPGDVLSVSVRKITVQVAGQVSRPGQYDLSPGSGLVTALALAGGLNEDAAIGRISVRRADGTVLQADLFSTVSQGDLSADLPLQDGDLVMVPQSKAEVAVIGAVATPGYYEIDEHRGASVSQLLANAGGPTEQAALEQIVVLRNTPQGPSRIAVNLKAVLQEGALEQDVALLDRDVIFVPEQKTTDWDLILRALTSVSLLGRWLFP